MTGNWEVLGATLRHLALPVAVLAFGSLAVITRMVRGGMIEILGEDYIRTARAKGIANRTVVLQHAVKNAFLPAVTAIGLQAGVMISGAFLVEMVFSWPGIGRYTVQAITAVDYNAIMSTTLVIAILFLFLNLVVDIMYVLLDPRIELA